MRLDTTGSQTGRNERLETEKVCCRFAPIVRCPPPPAFMCRTRPKVMCAATAHLNSLSLRYYQDDRRRRAISQAAPRQPDSVLRRFPGMCSMIRPVFKAEQISRNFKSSVQYSTHTHQSRRRAVPDFGHLGVRYRVFCCSAFLRPQDRGDRKRYWPSCQG